MCTPPEADVLHVNVLFCQPCRALQPAEIALSLQHRCTFPGLLGFSVGNSTGSVLSGKLAALTLVCKSLAYPNLVPIAILAGHSSDHPGCRRSAVVCATASPAKLELQSHWNVLQPVAVRHPDRKSLFMLSEDVLGCLAPHHIELNWAWVAIPAARGELQLHGNPSDRSLWYCDLFRTVMQSSAHVRNAQLFADGFVEFKGLRPELHAARACSLYSLLRLYYAASCLHSDRHKAGDAAEHLEALQVPCG